MKTQRRMYVLLERVAPNCVFKSFMKFSLEEGYQQRKHRQIIVQL